MARAPKETTFLVSSAGTGFFYTNRKNKKKLKGDKKLSLHKYDPIAKKTVLFEEKKLSKLKKAAAAQKGAESSAQKPAVESSPAK